jgi:hypothetical protein
MDPDQLAIHLFEDHWAPAEVFWRGVSGSERDRWRRTACLVQSKIDAAVAAAKAPEPAGSLDEPLDALADRLSRIYLGPDFTLSERSAAAQSAWRRVAAEAMKAAPPAPANAFTIPPLRSAYDRDGPMQPSDEQERRALRERVILAISTRSHNETPIGDMIDDAKLLINFINGQSP